MAGGSFSGSRSQPGAFGVRIDRLVGERVECLLEAVGVRALRLGERLEPVSDPATDLPFGGTRLNLKAAIAGETHEYTDMYPGMSKAARQEGFSEIADWFETLAKAERSHANRFQKALDALAD